MGTQKIIHEFLSQINILIGANVDSTNVVDAHVDTINFVVTRNKIYPQFHYAFSDGTEQSIFSNNDVFGGNGGIYKRGSLTDGVHIYENNKFNGISRDGIL